MRRARAFSQPDKPHADWFALEGAIAIELTQVALKSADQRRLQLASPLIDPLDAPQLCLGIEKAKSHAFDRFPVWECRGEFVDIAYPAEHRLRLIRSPKLLSLGAPFQPARPPSTVDSPSTK